MLESAEHGHAAGHGVRARAQTLVRQGFPGFELGDVVRVAIIPGAQRAHGLFGFAAGGHDQHDRLAGFAGHTLPDGGGQSRAQAFGDAGQDGVVDVVRSLDVAGGELQEGLVLFQLRQDACQ